MSPRRKVRRKVADVLRSTLVAGAKSDSVGLPFDVSHPQVETWARAHSAELVTDVLKDTRAAINLVVRDGLANDIGQKNIAKMVRSTIGLTERGAQAVMRAQVEMLARGVKPAVATARAEKYARKLVRRRATTIAQTETMRAVNEGQAQKWQQNIASGRLKGNEQKVWITYDPCPLCAGMGGVLVGINENFATGNPPLHPNCRCTIALVTTPGG